MKQSFLPEIFALTLALSLTFSASAQFLGPHLLPPSTGLRQELSFVRFADLDGDGVDDQLSVLKTFVQAGPGYSYVLQWQRNDGLGNFEPPQAITLSDASYLANIYGLWAADLDGNGGSDPIFTGNGGLYWLSNLGGGNFADPVLINFITSISDIGDIDGDSDPDLLGIDFDYKLHWVENSGGGTFLYDHPVEPCCQDTARLADFNGDGLLDICAGGGNSYSRWYPNLGFGDFSQQMMIAFNPGYDLQLFPADIDGDGDADLLGFHKDLGLQLEWWANDGLGNFSASAPIFTGSFDFIESNTVLVADFTGDNAPDILARTDAGGTNRLSIWINQNNAANPFVRTDFAVPIPGANGLQTLRLNGDNLQDWAYHSGSTGYVSANAGGAVFAPLQKTFTILQNVRDFCVSDLDGNGTRDFVFTDFDLARLVGWYANDGAGQFAGPQQLSDDPKGFQQVKTGDLDGDGDEDLLQGFGNGEVLVWRANDGLGNFGAPDTIGGNAVIKAIIDLDGDDDLDLALNYYWLINDGTGNFPSVNYNMPPMGAEDYAPFFGDLDADGDPDVVVVNEGGNMFWYSNDGAGNFSNPKFVGPNGDYYYAGISIVDMDNDGDPDVLSPQSFAVRWFENLGGAVFNSTPREIEFLPKFFGRGVAADFDRDGDNDLFTASVDDANSNAPAFFALYENLGGGVFASPPQYFGGTADCYDLIPRDLDDDGDLDVAWFSAYNIGWWENLDNEPYISGSCFWDKNENKIRDTGEPPITGIQLELEPTGYLTYAESNGEFKFFVNSGDYTLSYNTQSCWKLTTDSAEYHLTFAGTTLSGYQFGFKRPNDDRYVRPILAGGQARCSNDAPFWISLYNRSCNDAAGRVALVLDSLVTFVSSVPAPAAITGDTLWWDYDTIQPYATGKIVLMLHIADANHTGDTIYLQAFTWLDEPNGSFTYSESTAYSTVILCSFDPNDKMVSRPTVPNDYSAAEHELIYTIRFQNTGNDTAFLVRLRDTLSANLNWTTLRPLGSSHPYYVVFNNQSGLLQFTFEDIILPDSATNPAGSQGFVQFLIQLQPGLPPGTLVPNRAGIYFDANPVVLTNTAETRVSQISTNNEPPEGETLTIRPNPTTGLCIVRFSRPVGKETVLQILDARGQILRGLPVPPGAAEQSFDLEDLPAGLYFIRLDRAGQAMSAARVIKQ